MQPLSFLAAGRRLERLVAPLATVRRILPILWRVSPLLSILTPIVTLAEIAAGLGVLYVTKLTIDLLSAGVGAETLEAATRYVVIAAICAILFLVARTLADLAREAQGLAVADAMSGIIHEHAVRVTYAFYESPAYFDTLQRARQSGSQRPAQVVSNLLLLGRNVLFAIAGVAFIATISLSLLAIISGFVLVALLVRLYFTRAGYQLQTRRTQMDRRSGYIDWLLTSDHHAKELRLNGLSDLLRERFRTIRQTIRRERLALSRRRAVSELGVGVAAMVIFFASLLYLSNQLVEGEGTLGDLALWIILFQRGQSLGREMVGLISRIYEDHLYLGHLFAFLDMPPDAGLDAPSPSAFSPAQAGQGTEPATGDGFRLENVSFRYPGTDQDVLQDINLSIGHGEFIALVGANGSGKTSLIKLLCRLYMPTTGRITLDGVDIREMPEDDYRRSVSVLLQDYSHYAESVADNIRFGDVSAHPDPLERTAAIAAAAQTTGAAPFVEKLTAGYETRLTRLFDDGVELSVGQWQKVAMARAFYRPASLMIMDEPTSALDPTAEAELFDSFVASLTGRAALVISHRLSTTRQADRIYVLDSGHIVEAGSHDALMSDKGVYSTMFDLQGRHFRRGE